MVFARGGGGEGHNVPPPPLFLDQKKKKKAGWDRVKAGPHPAWFDFFRPSLPWWPISSWRTLSATPSPPWPIVLDCGFASSMTLSLSGSVTHCKQLWTTSTSKNPANHLTMEVEKDGKLPFLDAEIERQGAHLSMTVYWKPTHSGCYVMNLTTRSLLNVARWMPSSVVLKWS